MTAVLHRLRALLRRRRSYAFLADDPRYGAYDIGEGTYGEPEVVYWDAGARLTIGRFCSIGADVCIFLGGEHHVDWVSSYPFSLKFNDAAALPGYPHAKGDVVIGSDVWIGRGASILSGVRVGHGAVIGAGSLVARDVPPYTIVVGNPARAIRPRFTPEVVDALLRIAWWEWPLDRIREAWPLLQSPDVDAFVRAYGTASAPEIRRSGL
jgi:acetyltransferase-like isoleucine patch superfamily enzyme